MFTNYFKKYSKITQIIISIILEDYNTSKDYLINFNKQNNLQFKDDSVFQQTDNFQYYDKFIIDISNKYSFDGFFNNSNIEECLEK